MMTMIDTSLIRGKLLFDVSLSKYNTWGVGGNAECVFHPADVDDLSNFLAHNDADMPITWLGLGSNVLIRDGGIAGVVIVTQGGLNEFEFMQDKIYAQAGVSCAKLARAAVAKNLTGIEFMAGIPGTVGGALAMNAGAFGGQTWDFVTSVDVINRRGEICAKPASEYEVGYRYVKQQAQEWFVGAHFSLREADKSVVSIKELIKHRADTQPIGKRNSGSVFKNPPGNHAAKLIEECGLKGFTLGGASVSTKHANFIINQDEASAEDIERLIIHIKKLVLERSNVELIPEVKILGVAKPK